MHLLTIVFSNLQKERRLRNKFYIAIAALILMTCIYGWREYTLYQTEEQNYALMRENATKDAQIYILSSELNLANKHLDFLKLAIAPGTTGMPYKDDGRVRSGKATWDPDIIN